MLLHLSANARLSQYLKQAAVWRAQHTVVETPSIMTWNQWWQVWQDRALLSGELSADLLPKRVLTPFEAARQWESLLAKHSENGALLNEADTAKQLYQAWCLWQEYGEPQWPHGSQEWQVFQRCAADYQAWLSQHNWQDEPGLMTLRLQWFEQGIGVAPKQVVWHGFDELTPFMQRWQALSEGLGTQHQFIDDAQPFAAQTVQSDLFSAPQKQRYTAADPRDELQQVAAFCVENLQNLLDQQRPLVQIRIGVVAPNVSDIKAPLSYWLDDLLFRRFADHPLLPDHSTHRLYNLSLGEPLSQRSYVRYLLQTLSMMLVSPSLDYADWSQWLISPYTPGDRIKRQTLDKKLRQKQWATIRWANLPQTTENLSWPSALRAQIQAMAELAEGANKLDLDGFVELIHQAMALMERHSSVTLNSDEYQQLERFKQALSEFAALRSLTQVQNRQAWWRVWQQFLAQITHQSQSTWIQPIQIMGMLEAGGQYFDALWVMGLDDQAWPRPAQPNVFLPLALQRELQMPRCDAKRELDYAQTLTQRLLTSADQVVFSYARQQGEAELLASPLWQALDLTDYQPRPVSSLLEASYQADRLTWVDDHQAPPVEQGALVPGGTGILDAQRKCPLMAFIDFRLGAKYGLQDVEDGLASTDQGTVVHAVLENFWQQVQTQAGLLAMSDSEQQALLEGLLNEQFEAFAQRFSEPYLASEKQRMLNLLQQWLDLEAQRKTGFKVVATEQKTTLQLADMQFNITLDRIDQTDNGVLILDYKTGKASVNDLLKQSVEAPQLAVYLHQVKDEVAGLGYGLLHSDEGAKWSLVSQDGELIGKGETNWEKYKEKWGDMSWSDYLQSLRDEVEQLARNIQQGQAALQFGKESDVQYASGYLALRLPEARPQLQVDDQEAE
jgi:probable DNA repair protein